MEKSLKILKNGSDIRGIAVDEKNANNITLTALAAEKIAAAFVLWLSKKLDKNPYELKISVGRDTRITGEMLQNSVNKAFISSGVFTYNFGLISTPAMFMSCVNKDTNCDGAVMITASHLPYNRNGLKFFTKNGGLESGDISEILQLADEDKFYQAQIKGKVEQYDFLSVYCNSLCDMVRAGVNDKEDYEHPLKGLKIIVDAGNGAGGFYAQKVLQPLGANTDGSLFLEPDGYFPNHIPNPENEQAMQAICDGVLRAKADFGVIFDTDVDRAGAVSKDGKEINRNRLIALISSILLKERPNSVIVTDSITSSGLHQFLSDKGGVHHRFKRGYKNVINEAIRLNNEGIYCPLAIETSGHAALLENYFLDDGAYLVTRIIIEIALLQKENKTIESLISDLKEPLEAEEFRLAINCEDFKKYGEGIIDDLLEYSKNTSGFILEKENYEGARVSFDNNNGDGWFLLRMSLHEPLMPLNIESDKIGGVKMIAKQIYEFLKNYEFLNTDSLKKYCE